MITERRSDGVAGRVADWDRRVCGHSRIRWNLGDKGKKKEKKPEACSSSFSLGLIMAARGSLRGKRKPGARCFPWLPLNSPCSRRCAVPAACPGVVVTTRRRMMFQRDWCQPRLCPHTAEVNTRASVCGWRLGRVLVVPTAGGRPLIKSPGGARGQSQAGQRSSQKKRH